MALLTNHKSKPKKVQPTSNPKRCYMGFSNIEGPLKGCGVLGGGTGIYRILAQGFHKNTCMLGSIIGFRAYVEFKV